MNVPARETGRTGIPIDTVLAAVAKIERCGKCGVATIMSQGETTATEIIIGARCPDCGEAAEERIPFPK